MSKRVNIGEEVKRIDTVFLLVSLVVWAVLGGVSLALVASSSIAGGGVAFILLSIAVVFWAKLVKDWLNERERLLQRAAGGADVTEEIRRLREIIERLRESLET